jgi:hypothetical protein
MNGYNMQGNLDFLVQHCNTVIYKRSVTSVGTRLYSRIPIQRKQTQDLNSFRRELRAFLQRYSFHSVNELMPLESLSV